MHVTPTPSEVRRTNPLPVVTPAQAGVQSWTAVSYGPPGAAALLAGVPPRAALGDSSAHDRAGTARAGGPSLSACDRVSGTPPRSARSVPVRSGASAASHPVGGSKDPPPVLVQSSSASGVTASTVLGGWWTGGWGCSDSARRVKRRSLRRPRAPGARIGAGRRWPRARALIERGEQRGSRRRGALPGRGQRGFGAERAGASRRRNAANPTGNKKPSSRLDPRWSLPPAPTGGGGDDRGARGRRPLRAATSQTQRREGGDLCRLPLGGIPHPDRSAPRPELV